LPRKPASIRKLHESDHKAEIMDRLRRYQGVIAFRIEDTTTSGYPDIYVGANLKSTWWEVKLADPDFDSKGIQELTALRLNQYAGYCRYIIYREEADGSHKRVSICHPSLISDETLQETVGGHNHDWVVEYILRAHR
jgi:hypothetical protein